MQTRVFAASLLVFLLTTIAVATQSHGELVGSVTDDHGGVLPGVRVAISGPESRSSFTNERGEFRFIGLLPGRYSVATELAGFVAASAEVTVAVGRTEQLRLRMRIAALTETVTVSAESPLHRGYRGRERTRNTERYERRADNGFRQVSRAPLSTFSIDVDTASYANVRRFLDEGSLPPPDAVRIEEMINYFRYDYPRPATDVPLAVSTEVSECPWNTRHRLALIGVQSREIPRQSVPARNLVFLVDVSGSMDSPDKLPLVRNALRMLAESLTARDRVAIVVYAGNSGVVLPSTPGDRTAVIDHAIASLEPGGSTNGEAGIRDAYRLAREGFAADGINRVILATDGDFNVGVSDQDDLIRLIEKERKSGVFLSVLGVGTGNLNDGMMEQLADHGNGNYSYLDSLHEARKVLAREATSTLVTIAKDVKIQVEFNPAAVAAYHLVGYQNRLLNDEDFNDDTKDAGEIGAGHAVTALYEIVPVGASEGSPVIDPLEYQPTATASTGNTRELATVKVRYQPAGGGRSRLISAVIANRVDEMRPALGFASAVAEFGMLLRGSPHGAEASYQAVVARARAFRGADPEGDRAEFVKLAETAARLQTLARR